MHTARVRPTRLVDALKLSGDTGRCLTITNGRSLLLEACWHVKIPPPLEHILWPNLLQLRAAVNLK